MTVTATLTLPPGGSAGTNGDSSDVEVLLSPGPSFLSDGQVTDSHREVFLPGGTRVSNPAQGESSFNAQPGTTRRHSESAMDVMAAPPEESVRQLKRTLSVGDFTRISHSTGPLGAYWSGRESLF